MRNKNFLSVGFFLILFAFAAPAMSLETATFAYG